MIALTGFIGFHARRTPAREALVYEDLRLGYGALWNNMTAMAGRLAGFGIGPGDVVAACLRNSPAFYDLAFAASHVGAVFLPLNYRLAADEIAWILGHAGARRLFADADLDTAVEAAEAAGIPLTALDPEAARDSRRLSAGAPAPPAAEAAPDDVFRLMYTSGTTDRPKGVQHSYTNFYWKCLDQTAALGGRPDDRLLVVGPLYHVGGFDLPGVDVWRRGGCIVLHREARPRAILEAQGLTVVAPGARVAAVRGASFRLEPGQAAGVAGASASGKSTLARALTGVWRPLGGSVRLDGAELDQYGEALGRYIGYLPQEVVLFEGSVAENIARLSPSPDDEAVVEAAKHAGAHEMILKLPGGYDCQALAGGAALSGGQRQRIALARAFYGSPVVVVMDEPDSNLDAEGTMALARAVEDHKKRGGAAVIVAHRHGAFAQCDTVYLMENGRPVPASGGRGSAPVRQLQSGDAKTARGGQSATGRPAEHARDGQVASLTEQGGGRIRPPARGRDQQVAAAIARVTGARDGREAHAEPGGSGAAPGTKRDVAP